MKKHFLRINSDYQFRAPVTAWDESSRQAHWRNRRPDQPFFAVFNFTVTHESGVFGQLPGDVVGGSNQRRLKFSPNDAAIIHQVVYETVRNRLYSGWYKNEPDSLDAYMIHLQKGLKNWESFDKMYPASGTGTFTGDNGIKWYTNVSSSKDGETLTDAFIIMRRGSSLSATIPGGIRDLHFAMYQNAEIEVKVDGKSMGTFKPVREGGWNNHYFKIKDLNKAGDATVEFTCRSREAIMDNISWTSPK